MGGSCVEFEMFLSFIVDLLGFLAGLNGVVGRF